MGQSHRLVRSRRDLADRSRERDRMPHIRKVTRMYAVAPEDCHVTPDRLGRRDGRGGTVVAAFRPFRSGLEAGIGSVGDVATDGVVSTGNLRVHSVPWSERSVTKPSTCSMSRRTRPRPCRLLSPASMKPTPSSLKTSVASLSGLPRTNDTVIVPVPSGNA